MFDFGFGIGFHSDLGFDSLCMNCKNSSKVESSRAPKNEETLVILSNETFEFERILKRLKS